MKKKIITAALAIAMLAPVGAQAAEWIQLSSWSYAEVSGFVSDGLLPESMKGISDYKRVINRGEFCELVYSVLKKTGMVEREVDNKWFTDCEDYPAVKWLSGVAIDLWLNSDIEMPENRYDDRHLVPKEFMPEKAATRQWAAGIMYSILVDLGVITYDTDKDIEQSEDELRKQFIDYDEISELDGILHVVNKGIMSDMGDGCFHGETEMTVEQAVSVIYRMYKAIPRVIASDNESEQSTRDIGAGLTEEITEDFYYVKDGDTRLLALETDVYSMLNAAKYNDKKLVFAVNFNDKTDVFDVQDGTLLYTIPYIVNELDAEKGYAYTISSRFMPYYSGIHGMDNQEIMPPEYSRMELNRLMAGETDQYRAPDGWIYYSDWNDGGNMYRRDTNGENEQLLIKGHDCTNLQFIGGKIYFNDAADGSLHCVNADGTGYKCISENDMDIAYIYRVGMYPFVRSYGYSDYCGFYDIESNWWSDNDNEHDGYEGVYKDGSMVCSETEKDALKRVIVFEDNSNDELRDGQHLFRLTPDGSKISIADFCIKDPISALNGDGKLYFLNEEERYTKGDSPVYVSDNNELKCISGEYRAACIGFLYNTDTNKIDTSKLAFLTQAEVELGTYHILDLVSGDVSQGKLQPDDYEIYDKDGRRYWEDFCNDEIKVFYQRNEDNIGSELAYEYDGKVKSLEGRQPILLKGDYLYCCNSCGFITAGLIRSMVGGDLVKYNYKTGESAVVADDFVQSWCVDSDYIVYETPLSELKLFDGENEPVTIYPCKGIFRYGEVKVFGHMPKLIGQKTNLYKLDKEGNISYITEHDTQRVMYVPNNGKPQNIWR